MDNMQNVANAALDKQSVGGDLELAVSKETSNIKYVEGSKIMVIGVGGAGGNAVYHMQYTMKIKDVSFVACNTDSKALEDCRAQNKIQLGKDGIGAGNDPSRGEQLAKESSAKIESFIRASNAQIVFISAGMGGGTGTGASPVIAQIAKNLGILTIAVVSLPLRYEGADRYQQAVKGVEKLNSIVDAMIVVDNEKVIDQYQDLSLDEAMDKANDILGLATRGISELTTMPKAKVRVDIADVKRVLKDSGRAHIAMVTVSSKKGACMEAMKLAVTNPLLDGGGVFKAEYVLLNYIVPKPTSINAGDFRASLGYLQELAMDNDKKLVSGANLLWGTSFNNNLKEDELQLVLVASRFPDGKKLTIASTFAEAVANSNSKIFKPRDVEIEDEVEETETGELKSVGVDNVAAVRVNNVMPTLTSINISFEPFSVSRSKPAYTTCKEEINWFSKDADTRTFKLSADGRKIIGKQTKAASEDSTQASAPETIQNSLFGD